LPRSREAVLQLLGGPLGQRAQHSGGQAGAGVAVAGSVGRTDLKAGRGAGGGDARDGITTTVVVAEDLAEGTPGGGDGTEQPGAILDAVLVEGGEDAEFAQGVGKRESLVAREASADLLKSGHRRVSNVGGMREGGARKRRAQSGQRTPEQQPPP